MEGKKEKKLVRFMVLFQDGVSSYFGWESGFHLSLGSYDKPFPQVYHAMADEGENTYIFGGWGAPDDRLFYYNYRYNGYGLAGPEPSLYLMGHTLVSDSITEDVYLFGGYGGGKYSNKLY